MKAKELVQMAVLTAISIVLVYLVRFPIFASAPFLEYDMADVPILIGTFLFGPISGLLLTAAVSILQGLTVSAQSGWIGIIMHIIATGTFVVVAGAIYRFNHTRIGAIIALVCGSIAMTLMMIPLNLIFTVHFMGVDRAVVVDMLIPVIIPFNLIKACANSIVTFLVYKHAGRVLRLGEDSNYKV
ncbi:MAG: ECF transporter S component [Candidatus Wallacebacter cryptica]|jgi:riboflavin transporter FmnP|nr:ECF transporter S component [Bacillota bacterium]